MGVREERQQEYLEEQRTGRVTDPATASKAINAKREENRVSMTKDRGEGRHATSIIKQSHCEALMDRIPGAIELANRGGGHFNSIRSLIQRKAQNGEHVTWGSNDRVTLTVTDLETASCFIAQAAISDFLEYERRQAQQRAGYETWPDWHGDIGDMPLPNGWKAGQHQAVSGRITYFAMMRNNPGVARSQRYETADEAVLECWRLAREDKAVKERNLEEEAEQAQERG